ncbi:Cellulose synthase [Dillenia turbinata]|uniref:Cellulose synthase n=1 Tax=Dillenia turbinata TaxID=194707 RepID=A0AAN8V1M2_9MAGN
MANQSSLPLYEKISLKNNLKRAWEIVIFFLLLSLLFYRFSTLNNNGIAWLVAFLCEMWFAFIWTLTINIKWNPVKYKTFPQHLSHWYAELPPVDMFVTTADPVLEPPIITMNTVLSLLAVDYPAYKLACYVSDDGCSPFTFYSLVETSKFAELWVPFCKKFRIQVRAPFKYFVGEPIFSGDNSLEFQKEWNKMKDEYEGLCEKIERASRNSTPLQSDMTGDFAVFSNVIRENKEGLSDGMPHIVYISREKRPKHPHHFKAGAMNVLTRVSGVMTNAPFMLNVDCDMFVNNPQVALHAMCLLLGCKYERDSAFVMFPQKFYDGLKDDPFGNQLVVLHEWVGHGIVGIQGPLYGGTNCFHRRKVIYGLSADEIEFEGKLASNTEELPEKELHRTFGSSVEFTRSTALILFRSKGYNDFRCNLSGSIEAALRVADCRYEYNTNWGTKVGWIYGSATEDVMTGLGIHSRGLVSAYSSPDPPAFLGCTPPGGPASLTQQKRWATGLLEILFSKMSPVINCIKGKLQFRMCLAYLWIMLWGIRSIPELCYAALPAFCLITNSNFLPQTEDPALLIPLLLFVVYSLYTLSEYIQLGLSMKAWRNNERMVRIKSVTAWLFGTLSVALKILGLSDTVFEITKKDSSGESEDSDVGKFTFDESPLFIPATTIVLVHMIALVIRFSGLHPPKEGLGGSGLGEIICSIYAVLCFMPFARGLFGKGKYGLPSSTIFKSAALALFLFQWCLWSSGV